MIYIPTTQNFLLNKNFINDQNFFIKERNLSTLKTIKIKP